MTNGAMDTGAYRTIMRIAAIITIVYGLGFLLTPEMLLQMSQDPGVPASMAWVRWSGGLLVGFGLAQWLASGDAARQAPLVKGAAAADALIALALLYAVVAGEYQGVAWFIWMPIVISVVLAAAFCWLAQKYKAVL